MTLQEQALEAYQKFGAEKQALIKDPEHLKAALERELHLQPEELFRDGQGIVMARASEMYFHFAEDKLHVLLEQPGQKPIWNPFEGLVGLGRIVMMRDAGQFTFAVPPELNPL